MDVEIRTCFEALKSIADTSPTRKRVVWPHMFGRTLNSLFAFGQRKIASLRGRTTRLRFGLVFPGAATSLTFRCSLNPLPVAVMDSFSRYALSWRCFNTVRESQSTDGKFTGMLKSQLIAIRIDGKDRAIDNVSSDVTANGEIRGGSSQELSAISLIPRRSSFPIGYEVISPDRNDGFQPLRFHAING